MTNINEDRGGIYLEGGEGTFFTDILKSLTLGMVFKCLLALELVRPVGLQNDEIMSNKVYLFIAGVVLAGLTVVGLLLYKATPKEEEFSGVKAETRVLASIPNVPPLLQVSRRSASSLLDEISQLNQQIQAGREQLESYRIYINNLRNEQMKQNSSSQLTSQIRGHSSAIQEFLSEIKNSEYAEQEINRRVTDILREQNSAAQVARDQIEQSIRSLEARIRQTQEDITYWQGNVFYLPQREQKLLELNSLLQAQMRDLQALRDQRLAIAAEVLAVTQRLQWEKEQVLSEVSEDRLNIQDEIASLREQIYSLQEEQFQVRSSRMSLSSQISQAQKDYEQLSMEVQRLELSLRKKQMEQLE